MSGFEAIDALLASARQEVPLPPPEERRALRESLRLSRTQVAQALGVSPSTVGGWESGRDPSGEVREKYAYFLDGARARLRADRTDRAEQADHADKTDRVEQTERAGRTEQTGQAGQAEGPERAGEPATAAVGPAAPPSRAPGAPEPPASSVPTEAADAPGSFGEGGLDVDDVEALVVPRPCVLCGTPARHQVAGFPQHLDPSQCAAPASPRPAPPEDGRAPAPGRPPAGTPRAERPGRRERAASGGPDGNTEGGVPIRPAGRRVRTVEESERDLIAEAVEAALAKHEGDTEAATAALIRRAIPDAMALLDYTRRSGRYDVIAHPWLPDILRKQSRRRSDRIWEARPGWTRPELPHGVHEVTALDINGAYLSALKTHLPIGQLEYSTGLAHDRRRAGVHLITPPAWEHDAYLPNPMGSRDEPGPVWVTEPVLRLLLRLSGPKYGLCDPPEIHESFTSGATEHLLEKFRVALKDARDRAIARDDDVTLQYVKAMYSKFVATMGESHYNRELYRPDWMHIIRSQAFVNLWLKAYKAHEEGLTVVRAMGTDELHVIGDWRRVFPEGRAVSEVKVKDVYTVGDEPEDPQE